MGGEVLHPFRVVTDRFVVSLARASEQATKFRRRHLSAQRREIAVSPRLGMHPRARPSTGAEELSSAGRSSLEVVASGDFEEPYDVHVAHGVETAGLVRAAFAGTCPDGAVSGSTRSASSGGDLRGPPIITATEHERRRQSKRVPSGTKRHARRQRRRTHPRPRRTKGDKSKNAEVAFVGVIYTVRKTPDGLEGPINKRLLATFESHEALFQWLDGHARLRGYGKKRTILTDGSDQIWRNQQLYFPKATPCMDVRGRFCGWNPAPPRVDDQPPRASRGTILAIIAFARLSTLKQWRLLC